jgi:hypothetical protein
MFIDKFFLWGISGKSIVILILINYFERKIWACFKNMFTLPLPSFGGAGVGWRR